MRYFVALVRIEGELHDFPSTLKAPRRAKHQSRIPCTFAYRFESMDTDHKFRGNDMVVARMQQHVSGSKLLLKRFTFQMIRTINRKDRVPSHKKRL